MVLLSAQKPTYYPLIIRLPTLYPSSLLVECQELSLSGVGTLFGGLGCAKCRACVHPLRRTSPSTCRLLTLAGLGVSPGGFRAESRTVVGSQAPRVEASQGFYYSSFIQPNKKSHRGQDCQEVKNKTAESKKKNKGRRKIREERRSTAGEMTAM